MEIKELLRDTKQRWRKDLVIDPLRLEKKVVSAIDEQTSKWRFKQRLTTSVRTGFTVFSGVVMVAVCLVLISGQRSGIWSLATSTNPKSTLVFSHSSKKFDYRKKLGFQPLLPSPVSDGLALRSTLVEFNIGPSIHSTTEFIAVYQYQNNPNQTIAIGERNIEQKGGISLPHSNKPWVPTVIHGLHAYESSDYTNGHHAIAKIRGNVLFEVEGQSPAVSVRLVQDSFIHLQYAITTAPDIIARTAVGYTNAVKVLSFKLMLPRYVPRNFKINRRTDIRANSKTYLLPDMSRKSFSNFSASYNNGRRTFQLFESLGVSKLEANSTYTLRSLKVRGHSFTLESPNDPTNNVRILGWYDSKHHVTYNLVGPISNTQLVKIALSLN